MLEKNLDNIISKPSIDNFLTFNDFDINPQIKSAVASLGFVRPTPVQEQVIPLLLRGESVAARARTGSGKTAAYLVPVLNYLLNAARIPSEKATPMVLILVPTVELAEQTTGMLEKLCRYSKKIEFLNLCRKLTDSQQLLAMSQPLDVIITTPARILKPLLTLGDKFLCALRFLILDEADLLLSYGYLNDIKQIIPRMPLSTPPQSILLSATLSEGVAELASRLLGTPKMIDVADIKTDQDEADHRWIPIENDHDRFLYFCVILRIHLRARGKVMVFVRSVPRAFRLRLLLDMFGLPAAVLDPEAPRASRQHSLTTFGAVLIVPDNSIERGIDLPDVAAVVNFDFPDTPESYTHRSGRTARAGRPGLVLSFVMRGGPGTVLDFTEKVDEASVFDKVTLLRSTKRHTGSVAIEEIKQFIIAQGLIDAFRYRMEDAMRAVTRTAIRNARSRDLKNQVINSEKLRSHFEDHVADLSILRRNDGPVSNARALSHLREFPAYLVPTGLKEVTVGYARKQKNVKKPVRRATKSSKGKKKARRADPLKRIRR